MTERPIDEHGLDAAIARLVNAAGDDAPDAPDVPTAALIDDAAGQSGASHGWWWTAGAASLAGAALLLIVVIVRDDGSDTLRPVHSLPSPAPTSIAVATTPLTSERPSAAATVPASTEASEPTTPADVPPQVGISRPIVGPEICDPLYARDGVTKGVSLFARLSTSPVPIQIIGDPVDGPTGAFAMVQRYFGDDRTSIGQEAVDIEGTTFWVSTFPNGNGSVEWDVADGSQGYVRSRGLGRDELVAIAGALAPRPADATIPGFEYEAGTGGLTGLHLLHEQMNTDVGGNVHRTACTVASSGFGYRISAIDGDPIFEYGGVIDRPAPLSVGLRGGTLIVIDGPSDSGAPSVDDVVDADPATWSELLTRSEWPEGTVPRFEVAEDESVSVELRSFNEQVPTSTLTLRLAEREGVVILEVETAGVVLDPDAVLWKTDIEGRGGGLRTATVGGVQGYRIGEAPVTGEINITISIVDGGDFVLQTTGPVQLVLTG